MPNHFTGWDGSIIYQIVDTVKVASVDRIIVYLRSGTQVERATDEERRAKCRAWQNQWREKKKAAGAEKMVSVMV